MYGLGLTFQGLGLSVLQASFASANDMIDIAFAVGLVDVCDKCQLHWLRM